MPVMVVPLMKASTISVARAAEVAEVRGWGIVPIAVIGIGPSEAEARLFVSAPERHARRVGRVSVLNDRRLISRYDLIVPAMRDNCGILRGGGTGRRAEARECDRGRESELHDAAPW